MNNHTGTAPPRTGTEPVSNERQQRAPRCEQRTSNPDCGHRAARGWGCTACRLAAAA